MSFTQPLPLPEKFDETAPASRTLSLGRFARVVLGCGIAASWAIALLLMRYALPAQSDWGRITRWGDDGPHPRFWDYLFHYFYLRWQGRWASAALETCALSVRDPIRLYPLLLAGIVLVDAIALYLVCRWFTRRASRWLAVGMTVCGLALLWSGLPSIAEAVNWFNGAVENNLTLSLAAIALIGPAAATRSSGSLSVVAAMVLAVLALVVCGFHELYGLMLAIALATALAAAWFAGDRRWRTWAIVLVGAAIGLAINGLAPGNHFRMLKEATPHSRQWRFAALATLRLMARYLPQWLLDPKLIAASLWVAFSPSLEAGRVPWPTARRVAWRWVLLPLCAVLMAAGFFFPCWVFGGTVPPRTLSGAYVAFCGCWLLIVYAWTRSLDLPPALAEEAEKREPIRPLTHVRWNSSPTVSTAAFLLLGVSLVLTGNVPFAARDLARRILPWHAVAMRRYEMLGHASDPAKTVVVPPLPRAPLSVPWIEISADPNDWHNVLLAYYFHVHAVVATDQNAPPTTRSDQSPASKDRPESSQPAP